MWSVDASSRTTWDPQNHRSYYLHEKSDFAIPHCRKCPNTWNGGILRICDLTQELAASSIIFRSTVFLARFWLSKVWNFLSEAKLFFTGSGWDAVVTMPWGIRKRCQLGNTAIMVKLIEVGNLVCKVSWSWWSMQFSWNPSETSVKNVGLSISKVILYLLARWGPVLISISQSRNV